jgi:hypothetical protein
MSSAGAWLPGAKTVSVISRSRRVRSPKTTGDKITGVRAA